MSTNLTASPISFPASPTLSTPEEQPFGESESTPTVPLLMSNYTMREKRTENNASLWPPAPLMNTIPAPQPNVPIPPFVPFGSSKISAIPTGSDPFNPTFQFPSNSAVRPVDVGGRDESGPTTEGVTPTERVPQFLPPPSLLPAHPSSQNEFVPTMGGLTPTGNTPFSPTFPFPSPSPLRPAQNTVDVPSFLLRPSVPPQLAPPVTALTSPPPFSLPSSHDTQSLSLTNIASVVVLLSLFCSCCCFRYLCTPSDDPFGKRGAYRRIAEEDSDAFNAAFDENDDIYFDDSEADDAIELNELDNGDIALEEVNG